MTRIESEESIFSAEVQYQNTGIQSCGSRKEIKLIFLLNQCILCNTTERVVCAEMGLTYELYYKLLKYCTYHVLISCF